MHTQEARRLGSELARLINDGDTGAACDRLAPLLAGRTPFRLLDHIGSAAGGAEQAALDPFLDCLAAGRTMGGWVVIGSALGAALGRRFASDPAWAFARCREFIRLAGVWYAADSLAERLPGPALVAAFEPALALLAPWRDDPDRWVRRATGVAVHFWAKRARGDPRLAPQASVLLEFLEPLFAEHDLDAAKGVGWGLKTLGRYYPEQSAAWLERQLAASRTASRSATRAAQRAVVLRKALTYLPPDLRRRALGSEP